MSQGQYLNAPILLLKHDTEKRRGKNHIVSNINACLAIVDIIKTTLGPRGMDKLIHSENDVTITNDGATVLKLLDVCHPAASLLVEISQAQDNEVGDGTTSVVVLAGELLKEAKDMLEYGIPASNIIEGYRFACSEAIDKFTEFQVEINHYSKEEKNSLLEKCAQTALNSKLISSYKEYFSKMVVDAVSVLSPGLSVEMIGVKKITGGSVTDSYLVYGVAFGKTFSYAGFEQQPKHFENPKILLINIELELKAEKDNAEIRLKSTNEYQSILDAEWKLLTDKLDAIVATQCNVVLSKLPVGDLATQYFAERNVFCAGRVSENDMKRTSLATGAKILSTVSNVNTNTLGTAGKFEEKLIGSERLNIFTNCKNPQSVTFILRGGASHFVEEAARSLHDAIMIVRRTMYQNAIVGGGGSVEMELSKHLRNIAPTIFDRRQHSVYSFSKALESIPYNLIKNAGGDTSDILNKLRKLHHSKQNEFKNHGVDCTTLDTCDVVKNHIWELAYAKKNAIIIATEAACTILSIDGTISNKRNNQ